MSAGKHNFRLEKGSMFRKEVRWTSADGAPVDLTNLFAQMMVRDQDDNLLLRFSEETDSIRVSPFGRAVGKMELYLNAAQTGNLATLLGLNIGAFEGAAKYDLRLSSIFLGYGYNGFGPQVFTPLDPMNPGANDGIFLMNPGFDTHNPTLAHEHFLVEIDGLGPPNTFRWKVDGGAWVDEHVDIVYGKAQLLHRWIYIYFAAGTGHAIGDQWTADASGIQSTQADPTRYFHGVLETYGGVNAFAQPGIGLRPVSTFAVGAGGAKNDLVQPSRCSVAWPTITNAELRAVPQVRPPTYAGITLSAPSMLTQGTNYRGIALYTQVEITTAGVGVAAKFRWRVEGDATITASWSTPINVTGGWQNLTLLDGALEVPTGIQVKFSTTATYAIWTGLTGDRWNFYVDATDRFQWSINAVDYRTVDGTVQPDAWVTGGSTPMSTIPTLGPPATLIGNTGRNDCQFCLTNLANSGDWDQAAPVVYRVEIDGIGATNTFKWTKDGAGGATGIPITGANVPIDLGVDGTPSTGVFCFFQMVTNHQMGDYWICTVTPTDYHLLYIGGQLYTNPRWTTTLGHNAADYWTFTLQQKLVKLEGAQTALNNGVYAVARVSVGGDKLEFSRPLDAVGDTYDNNIYLREFTLNPYWVIRLLEGTMNVVEEVSYE